MKNTFYKIVLISFLAFTSCDETFLEKKSNKSLIIPTTLADFQALLDNADRVMNVVPSIGMIASDDGFTTTGAWQALYTATERNSYIWAPKIYEGEANSDWNTVYQQVFYSNVVLEGIEKISVSAKNQNEWNTCKGSALFFRAHAFYQLAQHFASPYENATASTDLGIPIRLTADVNAPVSRATQEQTYNRIIKDLTLALEFLPVNSVYKTRPTTTAAKALLAKVYLTMENYEKAEAYANESLTEKNFLLDYNDLNLAASRPIPRMNDEILFYGAMVAYGYTIFTTTYADTVLRGQYADDDLRKNAFFRLRAPNRYSFKGNYTASSTLFGGIANDEVYLIRSESRARIGDINGALKDLNSLLEKRWKTGLFVPIAETNPDTLLAIILKERQKELLFRSTRWSDLRRLNKDMRFAISLHRTVNATEYVLPPKDLRYTFPIPEQEIQTSGIEQNPR